MQWTERLQHYADKTGFPQSLFIAGDGRVVGTWIMGNSYRVRSGYYGGYINPDLSPTYVGDAQSLEGVPLASYDLVLADPPYSVEDVDHYGASMVKRNAVMRALSGLSPGAYVVWLDQVLPMWRADTFSVEAVVGLVKSSNHRFRVMTVFKRRDPVRRM
jgi:hypothetical protein